MFSAKKFKPISQADLENVADNLANNQFKTIEPAPLSMASYRSSQPQPQPTYQPVHTVVPIPGLHLPYAQPQPQLKQPSKEEIVPSYYSTNKIIPTANNQMPNNLRKAIFEPIQQGSLINFLNRFRFVFFYFC